MVGGQPAAWLEVMRMHLPDVGAMIAGGGRMHRILNTCLLRQ